MLEVCNGVTNRKEKDGGTRGPIRLWSEGPRVTGAPLCAKCLSVCSRIEPSGSTVVCEGTDRSPFLGESTSPL